MNKFEKHYKQKENNFYLEAGRVICKNGKELFSIHLLEQEAGQRYNLFPVEADALAHFVVDTLNNGKSWSQYLDKYIKS